jgi:hypothetical protein
LKRLEVKVAFVPQIEGLTTEDFVEYAQKKPSLMKYLPSERDWLHLDKKFICDVLYTLDTDGIQQIIDDAQLRRNARLEQKQDLLVDIRPEFKEALKHSITFSCKISPLKLVLSLERKVSLSSKGFVEKEAKEV